MPDSNSPHQHSLPIGVLWDGYDKDDYAVPSRELKQAPKKVPTSSQMPMKFGEGLTRKRLTEIVKQAISEHPLSTAPASGPGTNLQPGQANDSHTIAGPNTAAACEKHHPDQAHADWQVIAGDSWSLKECN